MRNLVHTKADKEMQLYILQKDFQFDIKQKMSLILLEQGMYTDCLLYTSCPSIYLVVEWVTISAPHSKGRQFTGVARCV